MKRLFYMLPILMAILVISSCTEDPVVIAPPGADFDFTIEGKTVSFTSTSTDADAFAWDFGDGESATDANPSHTYASNGSYIAKLTVTNDGGTDSKQEVLEIINITIDNNLSDWDDVPTAISGSGTVTTIKLENLDNNKLFIYVEGTTDLTPLTQILIDTDNDRSTGAMIDWLYFQAGEDVIIEGSVTAGELQSGAVFPCSPCDGSSPGNWNWGDPVTENAADFLEGSEMQSIQGGLAYEISIDLTALGTSIDTEGIGIAIMDVSLDTWGPVGSAPIFFNENDNPEGTLLRYTFK